MADPPYRFGPFLLDRTGYRAFRRSDPVELTPKLLDLLFYFVSGEALAHAKADGPVEHIFELHKRENLYLVEAIPTLGSGKVDLQMVRQIATGCV